MLELDLQDDLQLSTIVLVHGIMILNMTLVSWKTSLNYMHNFQVGVK